MSQAPFIRAARIGLRFSTSRGHLAVEDMFQLTLKDLDAVGQTIIARLERSSSKSLLANPDKSASKANDEDNLRLDIIKVIIDIKQTENAEAARRLTNKRQKDLIAEILEKKRLGAMEDKSIEELEKELASLSDD